MPFGQLRTLLTFGKTGGGYANGGGTQYATAGNRYGDTTTRRHQDWVQTNKSWLIENFGTDWAKTTRVLRKNSRNQYSVLDGHAGAGRKKDGKFVVINRGNHGWYVERMDNSGTVQAPG